MALYDRGVLSVGKVRALADRSMRESNRLLGERRVERHYIGEELDEDGVCPQLTCSSPILPFLNHDLVDRPDFVDEPFEASAVRN